jgi:hypothetical protein
MRTNYMIRAAPESCHDLRLHSDVWVQAMQAAQHLGLCSSQCNGESRRIIEALPYMSLHAGVHSCRRISDECSTVTETHVTQCTCDVGIIQICGHYCDESDAYWNVLAGVCVQVAHTVTLCLVRLPYILLWECSIIASPHFNAMTSACHAMTTRSTPPLYFAYAAVLIG